MKCLTILGFLKVGKGSLNTTIESLTEQIRLQSSTGPLSKPKHVCIAWRYYLLLLTDIKPGKFLLSEGEDAHLLLYP